MYSPPPPNHLPESVHEPETTSPARTKSFTFALDTIRLYQELTDHHEYALANQLLRSGTSIGANIEEATAAESRRDFLHKMNLALKEARETHYWLRLLNEPDLTTLDVTGHCQQAEELIRLLAAIVKTTRARLSKIGEGGRNSPL